MKGYGCFMAALLVLSALSGGCVETAIREGGEPLKYEPVEPPPVGAASEGGIWRSGNRGSSFLFYDQKARRIGDLVTVLIIEDTSARGDALTKAESARQLAGELTSDVGFQAMLAQPIRTLLRVFGIKRPGVDRPEGQTLNVIDSQMKNKFDGKGQTERSGNFHGVVTCRVIDVLPNGVYHVRGRRWITINHEAQYISVEGLVRREDLGINNTVASNALAEMRLSYDGLGTLDDKQRPGWLARAFDWI